MSKISSVFEIKFGTKAHKHYRFKKDCNAKLLEAGSETIAVAGTGSEALAHVREKYNGLNVSVILKGFFIGPISAGQYRPVDLDSPLKARGIPILN